MAVQRKCTVRGDGALDCNEARDGAASVHHGFPFDFVEESTEELVGIGEDLGEEGVIWFIDGRHGGRGWKIYGSGESLDICGRDVNQELVGTSNIVASNCPGA